MHVQIMLTALLPHTHFGMFWSASQATMHVLRVLLSFHSCTLCHVNMVRFTRIEACSKYAAFIGSTYSLTPVPRSSQETTTPLKRKDVCLCHATRKCLQFLRKS